MEFNKCFLTGELQHPPSLLHSLGTKQAVLKSLCFNFFKSGHRKGGNLGECRNRKEKKKSREILICLFIYLFLLNFF